MTRPSEENPDYVRYRNDKNKKKITLHHLQQRLAWEKRSLASDKLYVQRDIERMKVQEQVVHELEQQIKAFVNNG